MDVIAGILRSRLCFEKLLMSSPFVRLRTQIQWLVLSPEWLQWPQSWTSLEQWKWVNFCLEKTLSIINAEANCHCNKMSQSCLQRDRFVPSAGLMVKEEEAGKELGKGSTTCGWKWIAYWEVVYIWSFFLHFHMLPSTLNNTVQTFLAFKALSF